MPYEFVPMFWALILFLGCWGLLLIGRNIKEKSRRQEIELIYKERIEAMEKGLPVPDRPPESAIAQSLAASMAPREKTEPANGLLWIRTVSLALGLFFLFTGLGMCAGFLVLEDYREIWAIGLIPAMAGAGFLIFYRLSSRLGPDPQPEPTSS